MSQPYDLKLLESELSISQHLNWVLDNIYQNYKQGFNSLKEVLVLLKNGQNFNDKYQIDHYNNIVSTVEKNIALWENQYDMFDGKYRTQDIEDNRQKENIESLDYEKQIVDQSLDIKPYITSETMQTCEPLQTTCTINQNETFDNDWYSDDMYYMKSFEVLTPSSMDQIIATTIRDEMIDSGFENSQISINNCDEINSLMLSNLVNELEPKQEIDRNYMTNNTNNFEIIKNTEICPQENAHNKKRNPNHMRKSRQVDTRIWYKCGWDGCSFGSFYNGVVKRHSFKKHSGKVKIDKSSNSPMHRFKCDWPGCDVSLVAYHKLVEHKRKHTGEKPFKCKWRACNYATARLYSMIIHERTHKLDSNLSIQ